MRIRSKFLVGAAMAGLALTTSQAALGADFPVLRGSQFDEAPQPREIEEAFSWSGFYFGAVAGTSRTQFTPERNGTRERTGLREQLAILNSQLVSQGYSIASPSSLSFRQREDSGANFGGFAGYNFLFGDAVVGVEGDFTRLDHRYEDANQIVSLTGSPSIPAGRLDAIQYLSDYGSARLRFGYAMGRILPYATVGFAAGRGNTYLTLSSSIPSAGVREKNSYMYGLTAGVGIDAAILDNVFLRAEYLYTRFDSFAGTVVEINNVRVGAGLKF